MIFRSLQKENSKYVPIHFIAVYQWNAQTRYEYYKKVNFQVTYEHENKNFKGIISNMN